MFDMMTEITEILGKPLISNTPKIDDVIYEQALIKIPGPSVVTSDSRGIWDQVWQPAELPGCMCAG